jgi:endonuclease/exonuclease/phosphatase family metal-dependent hydrolase
VDRRPTPDRERDQSDPGPHRRERERSEPGPHPRERERSERDLIVLTWNLYHGRDAPPTRALHTLRSLLVRTDEHDSTHVQVNRPLQEEFTALIAASDWSVCLLQEAPPAWEPALARRTGAASYVALTSRNWLASVRRRLARWNPDLMGSWEGGSNTTLVRPPWRIVTGRTLLLNRFPARRLRERRRMSFLRLYGDRGEVCIANLHLSGNPRQAEREALIAATAADSWAGSSPLVLGGDFNLRPRSTSAFEQLAERFGLAAPTAADAIDHLLVRGLEVASAPAAWPPADRELDAPMGNELRRVRLSDHAPIEASYRLPGHA